MSASESCSASIESNNAIVRSGRQKVPRRRLTKLGAESGPGIEKRLRNERRVELSKRRDRRLLNLMRLSIVDCRDQCRLDVVDGPER